MNRTPRSKNKTKGIIKSEIISYVKEEYYLEGITLNKSPVLSTISSIVLFGNRDIVYYCTIFLLCHVHFLIYVYSPFED